jgi:RES domain
LTKRSKPRQLRHRVYRGTAGDLPSVLPGELLVEHFSDHELLAWRAKGKNFQSYHYLWYFELEGQRAAQESHLLDSLRKVRGTDIALAGWGRALNYKYSNTPLSCIGSIKWVGGRFNYGIDIDAARFPPFPTLYLAEDFETGLREMQGLTREDSRAGLSARELNLCAKDGVAWATISGTVGNVFDLTRPKNLEGFCEVISSFKLSKAVRDLERRLNALPLRLITTAPGLLSTFMMEHWRECPTVWNTPSNSQLFGHLLSQAGFEGVLFSSTRTGKKNLALFTRQFKNSPSVVKVVNAPPTATLTELTALNYAELEISAMTT